MTCLDIEVDLEVSFFFLTANISMSIVMLVFYPLPGFEHLLFTFYNLFDEPCV